LWSAAHGGCKILSALDAGEPFFGRVRFSGVPALHGAQGCKHARVAFSNL
jgi:hypothetical protein